MLIFAIDVNRRVLEEMYYCTLYEDSPAYIRVTAGESFRFVTCQEAPKQCWSGAFCCFLISGLNHKAFEHPPSLVFQYNCIKVHECLLVMQILYMSLLYRYNVDTSLTWVSSYTSYILSRRDDSVGSCVPLESHR